MKKHRFYLILFSTSFVAGCASAPQRTTEEHRQALFQLVRAGDDTGIQQYFATNETSLSSVRHSYTSCGDRDKKRGLYFGGPDSGFGPDCDAMLSLDEFQQTISTGHQAFRAALEKCKSDLPRMKQISGAKYSIYYAMCLGNIDAPIPWAFSLDRGSNARSAHKFCGEDSESGSGCSISNKQIGSSSLDAIMVRKVTSPESAGSDAWLAEVDHKAFLDIFLPVAQQANADADSMIASRDQQLGQRSKNIDETNVALKQQWLGLKKRAAGERIPYWLRPFQRKNGFTQQSLALLKKIPAYDDVRSADLCIATFSPIGREAILHCATNATENGYDAKCALWEVNLGTDQGGYVGARGTIPGKCDEKKVVTLIRVSQLEMLLSGLYSGQSATALGDLGIYVYKDKFRAIKKWMDAHDDYSGK